LCKPPWEDAPVHCASLGGGTVAVLTSTGREGGYPDRLFVSPDLQSWNHTDLPHSYMSLTTFQSKFVLVGGLILSTRTPTNEILTSDTGRMWKPSLPPMPTKRYGASTVGEGEALVVAGGQISYDDEVDVVEVLLGDKWVTVDPLPAPASWMLSTLHGGKLCLMKRGDPSGTIFFCDYKSLILTSEFSCNISTDKPLWGQFQAPGGWFSAVVSYFSRLVFVERQGIVKAHSSIARSWMTATSTGTAPDLRYGSIATAVLTSKRLVLAHQLGGVYVGTVSGE